MNSNIFKSSDGNYYKIEVMLITPKFAEKTLQKTKDNVGRVQSARKRIKKYAAEMKNGRWKLNGSIILFDSKGELVNGNTRFAACVLAQTAFETLVMMRVDEKGNPLDFDKETILSIDTGKERTSGDALKAISGSSYANEISAAIKRVLWMKIFKEKLEADRSAVKKNIDNLKTKIASLEKQEQVPSVEGNLKATKELLEMEKTNLKALKMDVKILGSGNFPPSIDNSEIAKELLENGSIYNYAAELSKDLTKAGESNKYISAGVITTIASYLLLKEKERCEKSESKKEFNPKALCQTIEDFFDEVLMLDADETTMAPSARCLRELFKEQDINKRLGSLAGRGQMNRADKIRVIALAWNRYKRTDIAMESAGTLKNIFANTINEDLDFEII